MAHNDLKLLPLDPATGRDRRRVARVVEAAERQQHAGVARMAFGEMDDL